MPLDDEPLQKALRQFFALVLVLPQRCGSILSARELDKCSVASMPSLCRLVLLCMLLH